MKCLAMSEVFVIAFPYLKIPAYFTKESHFKDKKMTKSVFWVYWQPTNKYWVKLLQLKNNAFNWPNFLWLYDAKYFLPLATTTAALLGI